MFLKNRNIISKMKRSKVTDYAALKGSYRADNVIIYNTNEIGIRLFRIAFPLTFCMRIVKNTFRTGLESSHIFGSNVYANALLRK